jgi:hypothetical protein
MAIRVTEAEVKLLMAPYADATDVTIFIKQGNLLVEEDLVGKGLSENRLRLIELNLAAHFATISIERGGFTFQRMGNSEEGYATDRRQVKFSSTRFGQQAIAMDSSGTLTRMDSPLGQAEFRVINPTDTCY